jgi:hypothetical protein
MDFPSPASSYPPFDGRIDHLVGPVRRIEWNRDVVGGPFQPITNFSDPALACQSIIPLFL